VTISSADAGTPTRSMLEAGFHDGSVLLVKRDGYSPSREQRSTWAWHLEAPCPPPLHLGTLSLRKMGRTDVIEIDVHCGLDQAMQKRVFPLCYRAAKHDESSSSFSRFPAKRENGLFHRLPCGQSKHCHTSPAACTRCQPAQPRRRCASTGNSRSTDAPSLFSALLSKPVSGAIQTDRQLPPFERSFRRYQTDTAALSPLFARVAQSTESGVPTTVCPPDQLDGCYGRSTPSHIRLLFAFW
jgi:hypothetical protein